MRFLYLLRTYQLLLLAIKEICDMYSAKWHVSLDEQFVKR